MDMTLTAAYLVEALVAVALALVVVLQHRRLRGAESAAGEATEALRSMEAQLDAAAAECDRLLAIARRAEDIAERADRARSDQFEQIQKTVHQRDGMWKLYQEMAASSGNLQDILLREVHRLGKFQRVMAEKHGFAPLEPSSELLAACGRHAGRFRDEKAAASAAAGYAAELDQSVERRVEEARRYG